MLERNVISKIKVTHMFEPNDALLKYEVPLLLLAIVFFLIKLIYHYYYYKQPLLQGLLKQDWKFLHKKKHRNFNQQEWSIF